MTNEVEHHERWLSLLRWLGALLLALISLTAHVRGYLQSVWPLLIVSVFVAAYNTLLSFVPMLVRWSGRAHAAFALDLVALTVFLHYSGDVENPLILAYVVPIALGAVTLSMRSTLLLAGAALLLVSSLIGLTITGRIPHHHLALKSEVSMHGDADELLAGMRVDYVVTRLLMTASAVLATGYGIALLAHRIREKERQLARENEQMALLLNTLPVGVVLMQRDGGIVLSNPAARHLLGVPAGETFARVNGGAIAGNLARFRGPLEEFDSTEGGRYLRHALAQGSAGQPLVWVFEDRTKERQLVGQLIHQSKMADLGILASGIAHEIGNPLSSLSAMLQFMRLKGPPGDASERIAEMETEVERINRIVQDITGFARPTADRSPVPLDALVEQAIRLFQMHRKSRDMWAEVSSADGGATVLAVQDQITQVILNLLLNAADASDGKGRIRVCTTSNGDEAGVSVIDQGVGMGPETRLRLFTPFFTTKQPGSGVGLGLFVSESIARAHGGRIDVESEQGRGSTFTLWLPRVTEAQP
jgi:signal transduction histidine kinase